MDFLPIVEYSQNETVIRVFEYAPPLLWPATIYVLLTRTRTTCGRDCHMKSVTDWQIITQVTLLRLSPALVATKHHTMHPTERLQQHNQQQQRMMASTRGERLTAHQRKKASRALVRARRLRHASLATVLRGEEWTGYEGSMRQGLRELDETAETKRRGTYASKPLVGILMTLHHVSAARV